MARKYSYWYIITESFDDRYKQYQRLIWKHPKDVNELFTITVANDETQDFETKTLFRISSRLIPVTLVMGYSRGIS